MGKRWQRMMNVKGPTELVPSLTDLFRPSSEMVVESFGYKIDEFLGRGRYAHTYLLDGDKVAKTPNPEFTTNPGSWFSLGSPGPHFKFYDKESHIRYEWAALEKLNSVEGVSSPIRLHWARMPLIVRLSDWFSDSKYNDHKAQKKLVLVKEYIKGKTARQAGGLVKQQIDFLEGTVRQAHEKKRYCLRYP